MLSSSAAQQLVSIRMRSENVGVAHVSTRAYDVIMTASYGVQQAMQQTVARSAQQLHYGAL